MIKDHIKTDMKIGINEVKYKLFSNYDFRDEGRKADDICFNFTVTILPFSNQWACLHITVQ